MTYLDTKVLKNSKHKILLVVGKLFEAADERNYLVGSTPKHVLVKLHHKNYVISRSPSSKLLFFPSHKTNFTYISFFELISSSMNPIHEKFNEPNILMTKLIFLLVCSTEKKLINKAFQHTSLNLCVAMIILYHILVE